MKGYLSVMSSGPTRQFAVMLQLGRFRSEADADRSLLLANRDANDPSVLCAKLVCCGAR